MINNVLPLEIKKTTTGESNDATVHAMKAYEGREA
jgi:hypothetical protein